MSALTPTTTPEASLSEAFRAAFGNHPAGVGLITALAKSGPHAGAPVGLTASSVASVSLNPLALMFSLSKRTGSAAVVLEADSFLVHLLSAEQRGLARQFASSTAERFTLDQGWAQLPTGEPYLPGVHAALRARVLETVPVGEATVVVAEVLDALTPQPHHNPAGATAEPMVYHQRTFHALGTALD